ncbi:MAG TPA: ABC transporter ATP-binding protein [Methanoculleus sp.]|nr:ABC transporter ATP-binding protein [Methanoculleus sp.]
MTSPVIELSHVTFRFNRHPVLDDVTLAIREGEFHAIIGPNGGGKTTVLKIMLGLLEPQAGSVRILGGSVRDNRRYLGYVPQFRTFDFRYPISVREMVLSGRLGHMGPQLRYGDEDYAAAEGALETMDITDIADREIADISGGQRQRAIIARALVGYPRVLLLDEPTVYVDTPTATHFYDILEDLRKEMTIVLITHDVGALSPEITTVSCLNHRIFTHDAREITEEMIGAVYPCPVDLIAHGVPHRVFRRHDEMAEEDVITDEEEVDR